MLTAWNQSSREYSFIRVGRPRYAVAVFEDSVLRPTATEHEENQHPECFSGKYLRLQSLRLTAYSADEEERLLD